MGEPVKPKLLIVGLDGAGFDIVRPLVDAGRLPNLAKLLSHGVHGDLESTVHPLTPLAWTSFLSGQNPGRHGIFDFFTRVDGTYRFRLVTSSERAGHDFIDILSERGLRIVSLNVPLTYPPRPVNGALISGMGTPNLQVEFTYPPDLKKKLLEKFPGYAISPRYDRGRDAIPPSLRSITKGLTDAAMYLIDEYTPDVMLLVYGATDVSQHLFWRDYLSPATGEDLKGYPDLIPEIYSIADEGLGMLIEKMGHDTPVLIVSDHGAQGLDLVVGLNRFLADNGYLVFFPSGAGTTEAGFSKTLKSIARKGGLFLQKILPTSLKESLKKLMPGISRRVQSLWHVPDMSAVDFTKSKAYAVGSYGGIFINLKGREPDGVVEPGSEYEAARDEITQQLLNWKTADGRKVVDRVQKREELYDGPYVERAPDLIVRLAAGNFTKTSFAPEKEELFESSTYQVFDHQHQSIHAMNGILIAQGYPFRKTAGGDEISDARIIDIAPTILHLLGLEIPADVDGIPLEKLFDPGWYESHPPKISGDISSRKGKPPRKLSDDEEKKLKDELQGLGYIS